MSYTKRWNSAGQRLKSWYLVCVKKTWMSSSFASLKIALESLSGKSCTMWQTQQGCVCYIIQDGLDKLSKAIFDEANAEGIHVFLHRQDIKMESLSGIGSPFCVGQKIWYLFCWHESQSQLNACQMQYNLFLFCSTLLMIELVPRCWRYVYCRFGMFWATNKWLKSYPHLQLGQQLPGCWLTQLPVNGNPNTRHPKWTIVRLYVCS